MGIEPPRTRGAAAKFAEMSASSGFLSSLQLSPFRVSHDADYRGAPGLNAIIPPALSPLRILAWVPLFSGMTLRGGNRPPTQNRHPDEGRGLRKLQHALLVQLVRRGRGMDHTAVAITETGVGPDLRRDDGFGHARAIPTHIVIPDMAQPCSAWTKVGAHASFNMLSWCSWI